MTSFPKLLLPVAYVSDVTNHVESATTRVCLLSMIVADDASTNDLINALIEAARRGVTVEVAADIFTYGELGGFFFPTRYRSEQSRATTHLGKRLKQEGVKFTWLGRSHATIFNGRMHAKWCIVDDTVYSFGGVNLYQKGIDCNDYMFKINDQLLADNLVYEYHHLIKADAGDYSYPSHSFTSGVDTVLIDGGFMGDSIIYRRACKLANEASRVLLVSQYCPTGKLGKILNKADTRLYFNPPSNASSLNKIVIQTGMFFSKHKTLYNKSRYLHAKFMIFDMPDGRKIALTGSHNFVKGGVLLGAREVALQTENPQTIKQLEDFCRDFVA